MKEVRWLVEGVDEKTGKDRCAFVHAHDEKGAAAAARSQGILARSVTAVANVLTAPPAVLTGGPTPLDNDHTLEAVVWVLSSGVEIPVAAVSLWPKDLLSQASQCLSDAGQLSEGFSTGLGFFGSMGYVVSRSLILGAAESLVSAGMQNQATSQIAQAEQLCLQARQQRFFCDVRNIRYIDEPSPAMWCANFRWPTGVVRSFVHDGLSHVLVRTAECTQRHIAWASVEQTYALRGKP